MGSRVLAVIPPAEGYGKSGNSQAGVTANDTLVFVVDMIKEFPNNASASGSKVSSGGGSLPTRHGQVRCGPDHHHPEVRRRRRPGWSPRR